MNGSLNTNGNHDNVTLKAISPDGELNRTVNAGLGPPHSNLNTPILGDPLSIREVAGLLGCSPWTIRQKYLPQGLPHLRTSAGGRLVFFRLQVIRWILKRQEIHRKGGMKK